MCHLVNKYEDIVSLQGRRHIVANSRLTACVVRYKTILHFVFVFIQMCSFVTLQWYILQPITNFWLILCQRATQCTHIDRTIGYCPTWYVRHSGCRPTTPIHFDSRVIRGDFSILPRDAMTLSDLWPGFQGHDISISTMNIPETTRDRAIVTTERQ